MERFCHSFLQRVSGWCEDMEMLQMVASEQSS